MTQEYRISSDWHLEIYQELNKPDNSYYFLESQPNEKDQILLLAGDICQANRIHEYEYIFGELSERFKTIYYVFGNHEYYFSDIHQTKSVIGNCYLNQYSNIKILDNTVDIIDKDTIIFGGTFWSDIPDDMYTIARSMMNDYRLIRSNNGTTSLSPVTTKEMFFSSLEKLKSFFQYESKNYKNKIILTHHALSNNSTHPRYEGSPINCCFITDLTKFIIENDEATYVHGHCHDSFDYNVGKSRVICNPKGYFTENENYSIAKGIII